MPKLSNDKKTTKPLATRGKHFSSTYQPKKQGRNKGSTPTDWLRRLSHTKVSFHNPITGKTDKGEVNLVVAMQLILKATQDSDLPSIKEYFDRIDGKVFDQIKHLVTGFKRIEVKHIQREKNKDADRLAKKAVRKSRPRWLPWSLTSGRKVRAPKDNVAW